MTSPSLGSMTATSTEGHAHIARHVSQRIVNLCFHTSMASYDVASIICGASAAEHHLPDPALTSSHSAVAPPDDSAREGAPSAPRPVDRARQKMGIKLQAGGR